MLSKKKLRNYGNCSVLYFRYLKQCHSVFEKLGIPGPRPSLLFGNVAEFKSKVNMSKALGLNIAASAHLTGPDKEVAQTRK